MSTNFLVLCRKPPPLRAAGWSFALGPVAICELEGPDDIDEGLDRLRPDPRGRVLLFSAKRGIAELTLEMADELARVTEGLVVRTRGTHSTSTPEYAIIHDHTAERANDVSAHELMAAWNRAIDRAADLASHTRTRRNHTLEDLQRHTHAIVGSSPSRTAEETR